MQRIEVGLFVVAVSPLYLISSCYNISHQTEVFLYGSPW